jgi:hypothetical protein
MRLAILGKFDVDELELLLNPLQHNRLIIQVNYDQVHSNRAVILLSDTNHRVQSLLTHLGTGNECKIIRNESEYYFIRLHDAPLTDVRPWTLAPPFIDNRPLKYFGAVKVDWSFPCILYKDSYAQFPHEVING